MEPLYHPSQQPIPEAHGIYRITCTSTGKIYVGSAIDLRNRWATHLYKLRHNIHHNPKVQASWNKYGEDAFTFEVLELVLIPELLTTREQHYIDMLKPFGKKGFNLAPVAGSRLGVKQPPEAIEKLRAINLGRKFPPEFGEQISQRQLGTKRGPETGKRISAAKTGKPSPHRGKKHSPEQIEKHRQAMTGYKHTEEAKYNMGLAQTGRKHSLESREKRRQSLMGHPVSDETRAKIGAKSLGRVVSPERRAKVSKASKERPRTSEEYATRRKKLIATAPDGTEYIVDGTVKFAQEHGLDSSSLIKVARGKQSHTKGWNVRYLEES